MLERQKMGKDRRSVVSQSSPAVKTARTASDQRTCSSCSACWRASFSLCGKDVCLPQHLLDELPPYLFRDAFIEKLKGGRESLWQHESDIPGANSKIIAYFCTEQQKLTAFTMGIHTRLGAHSDVRCLDSLPLLLIVNDVLVR